MNRLLALVLIAGIAAGCNPPTTSGTDGAPTNKARPTAEATELAEVKRVANAFLQAVTKGDHDAAAALCSKHPSTFRPDLPEAVRLLRRDPLAPGGVSQDWEIKSANLDAPATTAEVDGRVFTSALRPSYRMGLKLEDISGAKKAWRVISFVVES